MRAFIAFVKKELCDSSRNGKLMILAVLFFALGVMNPAVAKLTPWIVEMLSEQLADSGMTVTTVNVDALTSWTQFFKNIPMALIAFVFIYSSSFTKEYETGTLTLILTKGVSRYKILLAKSVLMFILWTVGYWFCFAVTYGYNAYFWDNSIAIGLSWATFNWWLFGIFTVALTVLCSVILKTYSGVLLCTGGSILAMYLLAILPKLEQYMPTSLMNISALLVGAEASTDYINTIVVTVILTALCIGVSIPIFNKKQI